jgi:hypothetical protein
MNLTQMQPESLRPESLQRLEQAEMEIQRLLQINSELTKRCEFLQQNFNGDYNELMIEYNALNRAFEILNLRTFKSPIYNTDNSQSELSGNKKENYQLQRSPTVADGRPQSGLSDSCFTHSNDADPSMSAFRMCRSLKKISQCI